MPDRSRILSIDNGVNEKSDRRGFLKRAALTAIAGGAAAACTESGGQTTSSASATASLAAKPGPASPISAAEAMDKMHEAGVKAFPAKTAGKGNQLLLPRIEKGVKIFELGGEDSVGDRPGPDGGSMGVQQAGSGAADTRP